MKKVLLYIWQLPQNILGLIFKIFLKNKSASTFFNVEDKTAIKFIYCESFPGAISLGNTIISSSYHVNTIFHEYGHQVQSRYLGPFYLLIIGLPSIIWAGLYGTLVKPTPDGYFKFFTESWADKLGGVTRCKN